MIRNSTRSGVMTKMLVSRAASLTGVMSPYPVVEGVEEVDTVTRVVVVAVAVDPDDEGGHGEQEQGHRQAFDDLADGAFHDFSREFHPAGHEMLVRLAGDRIMARQFHVKHSPIRLTVRFMPPLISGIPHIRQRPG
jgi:hypothetical protein